MAGWRLYDYVDHRGVNHLAAWSRSLDSKYRAMLHRRLKALEETEPSLVPGLVEGPIRGHPHIYKLKIGGKVRLRVLLCKGPIDNNKELTFLMGATERDYKWDPPNAPTIAEARRQEIISNLGRRCNHVKVL